MSDKNKIDEVPGVDLLKANRVKAQHVLDTFFKPLEQKSELISELVSDNPRTIRTIVVGKKAMVGSIVDKNNMEYTENKIKRKIQNNKNKEEIEVI